MAAYEASNRLRSAVATPAEGTSPAPKTPGRSGAVSRNRV